MSLRAAYNYSSYFLFSPIPMICTIILASALTLGTVEKPTYHSVQHFDNQIRVTQRVLDRTICKDLERVHPLTTVQGAERVAEKVKLDRDANRKAVEAHCAARLRAESKDHGECKLAK